jgi:hypothetical protein
VKLTRAVRKAVERVVPRDATVAVVSKGDEQLVELGGARRGLHFPQSDAGGYIGYHPADSAMAIAYLEQSRARGAQYFVVPATYAWWLDHYAGFQAHLRRWYRRVPSDAQTCVIFELRRRAAPKIVPPRFPATAARRATDRHRFARSVPRSNARLQKVG